MKFTKIFLIATSLIWTILNFFQVITSPTVVNLTSFMGIIPVVSALYSEVDLIYIYFNKARAYFFLKTVSFTPKSSRFIVNNITVDELEQQIYEIIKAESYTFDSSTILKTHEDFYLEIESINGLKNKLTLNLHSENDIQRLTIKADYQIAYRDVKEQWYAFLKLRNELFSHCSIARNTTERFDVTINTDKQKKFNPFYRLTVRHVGKKEDKKFSLEFKDKNLLVKTNNNKIYGTSNNYKDIEKLIKEYVALSRI